MRYFPFRARFVRFVGLFRKKQHEGEMNAELRAHLDALIERNLASGMSPDEARFAAVRAFGGVAQIAERARDERRSAWVEHLWLDLRYAARQLRKTPAFTFVAVLSLAIGIGANTAIFSFINVALLKTLPVQRPHELVVFDWVIGAQGGRPTVGSWGDLGSVDTDPATGRDANRVFSLRAFERFREGNARLTDMFAVALVWNPTIRIDDQSEIVVSQFVSGNYHSALGVAAFRGRTLTPTDDQPGAPPVAVISHHYWQSRFAGDPAAIGKTLMFNRVAATIVGVTPPGFAGTLLSIGSTDITLPLAMAPQFHPAGAKTTDVQFSWLRIMGRLKPGATREQAAASLEPVFHAVAHEAIPNQSDSPRLRATSGAWGRGEADRRNNARSLTLAMGLVALLLIAACANVANLLVARGATRRREIAVRLALGSGRGRIVRQLLAESVLLALLGAAAGLLLAVWGGPLLFFGETPELDARVLGFAISIAVVVSVAFGLAPALRATRVDLASEFQGGPRTLGGGARSRLSQTLMVVQVAISLVLLVGAALFARTVHNLKAIDVGFNRTHLLRFSVDGEPAGYGPTQFVDLHRRIAGRISALPGVRSVTYSRWAVLDNSSGYETGLAIPGQTLPGGKREGVRWDSVSENYFATLETPILLGRGLESQDSAPNAKTVVVNQAFAKHYFPDHEPIGQRIRVNNSEREIVGVVRDMKQIDFRQPTPPTVFVPFAQVMSAEAEFAVRTAGEPGALAAAVRSAVSEIDRNLLVTNVRTQDERVEGLLSEERLFARLTTFFGIVALALACIGLYGLMSYSVHRRTGEIGLRMALGALPAHVLRMILRESLSLVLLGVAVGLLAAAGAVRLVANLLYGLSPTDAPTYAAVAVLLIAVALLAALLPARHAAKIDPMIALRAE
jgi:predicted permease